MPRDGHLRLPEVRVLARLRDELRGRPRAWTEAEVLALPAHVVGTSVVVGEGESTLGATSGSVAEVVLVRGLFASIPGRAARVALLRRAVGLAPRVVLHVAVADPPGLASRLARIAVDGPRAVTERILGGASPLPSPGDRFEGERFVHLFPDEEPLLRELAEARLAITSRDGETFVLAELSSADAGTDAFATELARVGRLVAVAERARNAASPEAAVRTMRARGLAARERGALGRARLRRAIGWVDALHPRGPNCYRRTLLELALDRGAAGETLVFGLDVGRTGHVAFKGREELGFDVLFELPSDLSP